MIVIGVDFHSEFQQIASVDTESGEFEERRLQHRDEVEKILSQTCHSTLGWTKNEERQLLCLVHTNALSYFLFLRHYRVY
jgi:hypothetical protein